MKIRQLELKHWTRKIQNVLGSLDDFVTRSGFSMKPIVIWGGKGLQTQINPNEVASLHRIPVSEFLRPDAPLALPFDLGVGFAPEAPCSSAAE